MNELKYITLDRLMDILQSYKDNFGGNIPILLSDKDIQLSIGLKRIEEPALQSLQEHC